MELPSSGVSFSSSILIIMKGHKEQLEDIVHVLESKQSFIPSFWILRGLYLVKTSRELKDFERTHYTLMLHDFYKEYYRKHDF